MNTVINSQLLATTSVDSGALNLLGKVVHQFSDPGYYLGTVWAGDQAVGRFHLQVDPKNNLPQTNVDLASLVPGSGVPCASCPPGTQEPELTVNPKGYVLFYVSRGAGGYAVTVASGIAPDAPVVFDSRKLQPGDYFIAQILQPGQYKATNLVNQQVHTLEVATAPAAPERAYVPPSPALMQAQTRGFALVAGTAGTETPHVQLAALQPKVYQIQTPSRIQIELTAPATTT
jgi:hypothetical protein